MELESESDAYWETKYAEELEILENQTEVDSLSSPALVLKPRSIFSPIKHSGTIDQISGKENQINGGLLNRRKRRLIEETDDEQPLFLRPPVEKLSEIDRFFSGKRQRTNIEMTRSYIDNDEHTAQDSLSSSPVQNPIHSRLPKEPTLQRSSSELSYTDILDLSSSPLLASVKRKSARTFGISLLSTSASSKVNMFDEEELIYPSDDEVEVQTPATSSPLTRVRDSIENYTLNRFETNHTTSSGISVACDESETYWYRETSPSKSGIYPPPQLEEAKKTQGYQNDHIHISPVSSSLQTLETNDDIPLFLHRTKSSQKDHAPSGPTSPSPVSQGDSMLLFPRTPTRLNNDNEDYHVQRRPTSPSQPLLEPKLSRASAATEKIPILHKTAIDFFKPPEDGGFIVGKTTSGKTLYFPRVLRGQTKVLTNAQQVKFGRSNLISVPVYQLMEDINYERNKNNIEKDGLMKNCSPGEQVDDMDIADELYTSQAAPNGSILWVEKYRPQRFLDLTSGQIANKDILHWLKEWDFCVFGKPFPPTKKYQNHLKDSNTNKNLATVKENKDPLKRPERKILLLAGPPGLGKTTLAHVIAKHCGYNIIEINASDDRTGATVLSKIKAATEMQAIVSGKGADKGKQRQKANCLIIDEIDGVCSGGGSESFIKILINLVTAGSKPEKEHESPAKNRKKHNSQKPLLRPIICICNDQYTPALRPLRQIAKIVTFKKVPNTVIARRLKEICDMEDLETDMYTLNRLCDMTDGDIRSCLNTLQFMRDRGGLFTHQMLENSPIGKKDLVKGVFDVWEAIFQKENEKKRRESKIRTITNYTETKVQLTDKYINRLGCIIASNGEYEKLMQGCFESYPRMKFHDNNCQRLPLISEWIFLWDHINTRVNSTHEKEIYPYMLFPLIAFHRYCAGTIAQNKVGYPRQDYENSIEHKANEDLVKESILSVLGQQRNFTRHNVSSELLSPLLRIISPPLKPVNKQLLKTDERIVLLRLVEVMISLKLSFVQERTDDGQFVYRLEPPIEKLVQFDSRVLLPNRYAVRQLIAHEIDLELMRRSEGAKETKNMNIRQNYVKTNPGEITQVKTSNIELLPTDFFGRAIVINTTPQIDDEKPKKPRVRYRFHEGFSNAVRKKMRVANFY